MSIFAAHTRDLAGLADRDRLRELVPRAGRDFSSNDYLGMAASPRLAAAVREALDRRVPLGSGGSRLLRGNHAEHEALEEEAARFFGSESALFFSSGYAANAALLSTLPQRGDLVVYDALVHASAHEGMRLGRADCLPAAHNDPDGFADVIGGWRRAGGTGRVWIAVESLYSMDGDRAPLPALVALAARHDAFLLIDEAHATGVFGPDGRGLAAAHEGAENVITLRTCGKALGCEGALLCGPKVMRDFLINRGRAFIFSTAPSPLIAATVREALRMLADEPERRVRLHGLIAGAAAVLATHGAAATGSQIVPILLGEDARTMRAAQSLQAAGFDVRGIRPPTVPPGTSRLRISLTLNVTPDDVSAFGDALGEALA
ncbi:MAG: 8-amino-7-oxononanoate synthase [Sphingomonadales bacterium]|nr:MAG: 8-amino-7-oxononanoate synthase [Sphingomonadales bacterium]